MHVMISGLSLTRVHMFSFSVNNKPDTIRIIRANLPAGWFRYFEVFEQILLTTKLIF